jgi:hypothetical protein
VLTVRNKRYMCLIMSGVESVKNTLEENIGGEKENIGDWCMNKLPVHSAENLDVLLVSCFSRFEYTVKRISF